MQTSENWLSHSGAWLKLDRTELVISVTVCSERKEEKYEAQRIVRIETIQCCYKER